MSAYLYDEALLKKLQQWCKGTNLTITGVNDTKRMFSVIADNQNDKPISLPLITLSRNGGYKILNKNKRPLTYNALPMGKSRETTVQLNGIEIELEYQIDIYARLFQEADEWARSFVFNLINYPQLMIEIPYENVDLQHMGNVRIQSDVEDNSDIPERLIPGQFTRLTITVNIDDAYLFDVKFRGNYHLVEVDTQTVTPPDEYDPRELVYLYTSTTDDGLNKK